MKKYYIKPIVEVFDTLSMNMLAASEPQTGRFVSGLPTEDSNGIAIEVSESGFSNDNGHGQGLIGGGGNRANYRGTYSSYGSSADLW